MSKNRVRTNDRSPPWYTSSSGSDNVTRLARAAFPSLLKDGEQTPLLAFCDALQEAGENPPFERRLREMLARPDLEDVLFFLRHTGANYDPAACSLAEARVRVALQLRGAERWFKENEWTGQDTNMESILNRPNPFNWLRFRWLNTSDGADFFDDEYGDDEDAPPPSPNAHQPWRWSCYLERWTEMDSDNYPHNRWYWSQLCQASFQTADERPIAEQPLHRVVQANLALDAKPFEVPRTTDPDMVFNALLLTDAGPGVNDPERDYEDMRQLVHGWSDDERAQAYEWAVREHLRAAGNDHIERVKCPDHVNVLRRVK